MYDGRIYFALRQYPRYLSRTVSFHTKREYLFDHLCGFLVHKPLLFVFLVFHIAIRGTSAKMFTRIAFRFENSSDFFTRILCIPLVDDIAEGRKVAVVLG